LSVSAAAPPAYDEQTDKSITVLQRKVDGQIVQLITLSRRQDAAAIEKASYVQNIGFYDEVDTDLTVVETRMLASADRSAAKLAPIFKNLPDSISDPRQLHEEQGRVGMAALVATRNQLDVQFSTLLAYELSLKTGTSLAP
jgi:hypothetical protein